jgi:hypothetical protein
MEEGRCRGGEALACPLHRGASYDANTRLTQVTRIERRTGRVLKSGKRWPKSKMVDP